MVYKNANTEAGEPEKVIRGFKFVPVSDVAQTDGEDLPTICNRLDGDDPAEHYTTFLDVARSIGFTVENHEFNGTTNGDCTHSEHRIRVETRNTPAQRVKTYIRACKGIWRKEHPRSAGEDSRPGDRTRHVPREVRQPGAC